MLYLQLYFHHHYHDRQHLLLLPLRYLQVDPEPTQPQTKWVRGGGFFREKDGQSLKLTTCIHLMPMSQNDLQIKWTVAAVCQVAVYGLEYWGLSTGWDRDFAFRHNVHAGSGTHRTSCSAVSEAVSQSV
jgi:hypothetical protein